MTDVHTPEQRHRNMAAIRGKNTKPEMRVRSLIHSLGYRFRLHRNDLAGKPDIVLPKHHKVIFVNGCFWHSHACPYGRVIPATRRKFWTMKRKGTIERDKRNRRALNAAGWKVLTIWECEIKNSVRIKERIIRFLNRGI
ncbi:MAG: very short patch repair endonuclease [Terracidiphilus sp.]|jgi:DNA mismatch endonuclease (patch repair protein)